MSNEYFDLTTTGVAYINRFRKITPQQGNPYYSITLAAMRGKANNEGHIQKTYIDCNIVGEALEMAKQIEPYFENDNDPKVMAKFVAGDLELRPFEYASGARKGERGFALKARLFDIKWFKAEGKTFYSEAERLRHEAMEANESSEPEDDAPSAQAQSEVAEDSLPNQVKLVKDDPYFDERKAQLKEQGYCWDNDLQLWVLNEVAA